MEAYSEFAQVYDLFMDNIPYEEWCDYLVTLLKNTVWWTALCWSWDAAPAA